MKRPNGSGSVVKLSGKRRRPYAVKIFDGIKVDEQGNGHLKYKYLAYFEKQKEALKYLEKFNTSPVALVTPQANTKKHRFSDIYELYIQELKKSKSLSQQSYASRDTAYNQLKKLHNMVFEQITLEDIESVMSAYSNSSLSTVSNQRIVLKGMYKTAMRHKYIHEDISALIISSHAKEPIKPHEPFTDDEINTLWQNKDNYFIGIYIILVYTGLRINELLSIKSADVHLSERYMIGGSKTEAGKGRMIPLSEKIIPFIDTSKEYIITHKGKELEYHNALRLCNEALASIGLEHSFHDARHTCASLMERAGIDMLHRKRILGHKSNDITDHYTHIPIEDLVEDINKI